MQIHKIMWWNLENLFEVETDPLRPEWLKKELKSELKGWSEDVLKQKINNLASIIRKSNSGKGPDILGCCEIENERVLARLIEALKPLKRDYRVLHRDTKDKRGIDVAFIYDAKKYQWDGYLNSLEIMKRTATRDLVQVNLKTIGDGHDLILIGAHLPARTEGQYESEPFRIMVCETLGYWIMRTIEIKTAEGKPDPAIVVMGDFNDEPYNRALVEYALSTPDLAVIENARSSHYLFNPMWKLQGEGKNTFCFGNQRMIIDQFLLSEGIAVNQKPFKMTKVDIVEYAGMTQGSYNTPVRFSRPSQGVEYNPAGFSDHLPIMLTLQED